MTKLGITTSILVVFIMAASAFYFLYPRIRYANMKQIQNVDRETIIPLPPAQREGPCPLERALAERISVRKFSDRPLSLAMAAQLLWAAQGVTAAGRRTTASAGALYPLELYFVSSKVEGLSAGIYHYQTLTHSLTQVAQGEVMESIARAALGQMWLKDAPGAIVICTVTSRTAVKYGARSERYAIMEAGSAVQNVYLQAAASGLGTVAVGAFAEQALSHLLQASEGCELLAIMPVGYSAE